MILDWTGDVPYVLIKHTGKMLSDQPKHCSVRPNIIGYDRIKAYLLVPNQQSIFFVCVCPELRYMIYPKNELC